MVSVAAIAEKKKRTLDENSSRPESREPRTDIATQSVIPPSIVGALLRPYVLAYVCSIYKSQRTHIRARVRRETATRYADAASVLLAISEIASETRKSFIFFAVCRPWQSTKCELSSLSLSFSLFSFPFTPSRRLSGCAPDFSIWIESDT